MKKLPAQTQSLWGQESQVEPYLLDAKHGDGEQWLWFLYLDDRPSFYVVRVDSAADMDSDDFYENVVEWIYDTLDEESYEFMSEECEDARENEENVDRGWPVPPINPCGSCWGEYVPDEKEKEVAGE